MSADALRPDPVIGTGQRMLMLQGATIANRLSDFATVAAALFRAVATGVDPERLTSQRRRTREFVKWVKLLESSDQELVIEYSELVPGKVWSTGAAKISLPTDLGQRLDVLLTAIDAGTPNPQELENEAHQMNELADTFHEDGREQLLKATDRASMY